MSKVDDLQDKIAMLEFERVEAQVFLDSAKASCAVALRHEIKYCDARVRLRARVLVKVIKKLNKAREDLEQALADEIEILPP